MKIARKVWMSALFLLTFVACSDHDDATPDNSDDCLTTKSSSTGKAVEGQYIISFENEENSGGRRGSTASRVFNTHGLDLNRIKSNFSGDLDSYVMLLSKEEAHTLKKDSDVAFVEPDRIISVCACFTVIEPKLITWNVDKVGYGDGGGKTAWILDTGIDSDHPDLNVDKDRSRSFLTDEPSIEDENGHGTHVAGIIGAKNNSIGTLGVASGATLVGLKVLNNQGEGFLSALLNALTHVKSNGHSGDVVNISIGVNEISDILDKEVQAISNRGIYVTIASGNDGEPADKFSPARATGSNIYTITAVDSLDNFAQFSNYGNDVIDFAAPGVRILSTYTDGRYAIMSGTSMAAPHVAGLLLITNGKITSNSFAIGDPDGTPDPIAHQ